MSRKTQSLACITAFTVACLVGTVSLATQRTEQPTLPEEQKTAIHFNDSLTAAYSNEAHRLPRPVALVHRQDSLRGFVTVSWYGEAFHGKRMANGKFFDMNELTVAHKSLPFGTRLRLQNPENGSEVVATVTDRGPYIPGRDIDLSKATADELGLLERGIGRVRVEVIRT